MVSVYHDADAEFQEGQRKPVTCTISVRPEIANMSPYTPGESLQAFSRRTGVPVESSIKLNANESPYGPVPAAQHALRSHDWYNQYPDTTATQLKEAIAHYTCLDTDNIVLGHGSMEIINILWNLFLAPGDAVLSCPPTFSLNATTTQLCGAQLHTVQRTRHYEIDTGALRAALALDRVQQVMETEGIPLRYFPQLEKGQDYLRVTIGLPEHTSRLAHALAKLNRLTNRQCQDRDEQGLIV